MESYNTGMIVSGAVVTLLIGIIGAATGDMAAAYLALAAASTAWLSNVTFASDAPEEIGLILSGIAVLLTIAGVFALFFA